MHYSPICVFAFRRPSHFARVLTSLAENEEASRSDLYIYIDAPKSEKDVILVEAVARIASQVTGFKTITIVRRETNWGLSRSIVDGIGTLCAKYGRVIVLEDDVVVSEWFLRYMNDALTLYEGVDKVMSIGCYTFSQRPDTPETFLLNLPDCWGWGVWDRSWRKYCSDGTSLLKQIDQRGLGKQFDFEGAYPYRQMLIDQIAGRNNSWAIRWSAVVLLEGGLTLYPRISVTDNIGFDGSGEHCGETASIGKRRNLAQPIVVAPIEVAENGEMRKVWGSELKRLRQGRFGFLHGIFTLAKKLMKVVLGKR